jgi:hypothetical protein
MEGRRSAGRCVATAARNKRLSRCVRWVTVAKFSHADTVGLNRLRLIALVSSTRLTPATYRLGSMLDASNGDPHAFITQLTVKPSA